MTHPQQRIAIRPAVTSHAVCLYHHYFIHFLFFLLQPYTDCYSPNMIFFLKSKPVFHSTSTERPKDV